MTVFSKIRDFVNRNRNKFIIGGVFVGSTILLMKYAQQKLKEYQAEKTKEFIESSLKQQHFESTERTCNQTILNLVNNLNEALSIELNTEEIIKKLRSNPDNKLDLWDSLKIMVFSRTTAFVYLCVILVITLRIQLNVLGAKLFKDSSSLPQHVQEEYLMMCQYLINRSVKHICSNITEQVKEIVANVDLKMQMSLTDIENIFWQIQTAILNCGVIPLNNLSRYVVEKEPMGKGVYEDMMRDTTDILDSDEIQSLAVHCINRGFSILNDVIMEYYMVPNGDNNEKKVELCDGKVRDMNCTELRAHNNVLPTLINGESDFTPPRSIKIPLAKLIPIINGLFAKNLLPDTLMQFLITNDKLRNLGANIYEALG